MIGCNGGYELDLADEILMNKLIRNGIKFDKFLCWYNKLNIEQQSALVATLFEFAYQSGVTDSVINRALEESEVSKSEPLIQSVLTFKTDLDGIEEWYLQLTEINRSVVFKFAVYYFGVAENNVFIHMCSKSDNCDHWWHRNILDDNIVKALIDDPKFYLTSKKDD